MAERRRNFLCYLAGADKVAWAQRDGCHARMSTSSVFFAHRSEVYFRRRFLPWAGADGNLRANRRCAHSHGIKRIGTQIIRHELVVALKIEVAHVKINHAIPEVGALA